MIQAQIDALEDENDELDRQKNLQEALRKEQEALAALERAKNQRSKLLYKDGQLSWSVDDSSIKEANKNVEDAQEAVDDARRDIAIANLQLEIDAIQDGIDKLEEQKAKLEALADESDAYFDQKIVDVQNYQNEWKKVLEIEERAIAIENLKSMFGEDAVAQILNGNMELLAIWKQEYVDTMAAIDLANTGMVGSITSQWAELAGISVDMEHARELSELSMDELTSKAESLGISIDSTKDASKGLEDSLNSTDTSAANEQFQNTGEAAQDTQEQVQGVINKLNDLSADIQSYSIPPLDTQQLSASLGGEDGTGGILGQLNTFIERFREICNSIPSIWSAAMSSISGQGSVPGESVSYDSLFVPLLNAMDGAKQEMDGKLQEYAQLWTQFNADLGGIIGVSSSEGGAAKDSAGKGNHGIHAPSKNSSKKGKEQSGTDTIVGTITAGGEASTEALNEAWIPGFESFASSIDSICSSVCSMIADMANEVIDMVNAALKALKELKAKNTGAYKIKKVKNGYSAHPVSSANAFGTLSYADGQGAITKNQESVVNELGHEMIARDGVLFEITGGAQKVQLKKGDIVFNHKQTEELKKYNRVTSNGGRGRLISSFASGTASSSKIRAIQDNITSLWDNPDFQKILEKITELKAGQDVMIEQNKEVLRDEKGNPYPEGTMIKPDGRVIIPLPEDHPTIQLQKKFEAYLQQMGGFEAISSGIMAEHSKQMETMAKQITTANSVTNNNVQRNIHQEFHITLPNVTDSTSADALMRDLQLLSVKKYQAF